jgi:hypothetical protein
MKTIMIFLMLSIVMLAQPTIKTKIQKPAVGVTYTVYADVRATNTTSPLVEDLDIEKTNVASYIKTLSNVTVSGDTTFGEFTIPASTATQYIKCGVVANSTGKKPSLMKVSSWLVINPRETKPAFIILQEK